MDRARLQNGPQLHKAPRHMRAGLSSGCYRCIMSVRDCPHVPERWSRAPGPQHPYSPLETSGILSMHNSVTYHTRTLLITPN